MAARTEGSCSITAGSLPVRVLLQTRWRKIAIALLPMVARMPADRSCRIAGNGRLLRQSTRDPVRARNDASRVALTGETSTETSAAKEWFNELAERISRFTFVRSRGSQLSCCPWHLTRVDFLCMPDPVIWRGCPIHRPRRRVGCRASRFSREYSVQTCPSDRFQQDRTGFRQWWPSETLRCF